MRVSRRYGRGRIVAFALRLAGWIRWRWRGIAGGQGRNLEQVRDLDKAVAHGSINQDFEGLGHTGGKIIPLFETMPLFKALYRI